ncbi:MAG: dihydrodipicolinate synthase family protein [Fuerstiella sp.]|nr:dihydrodipicolinate synthase family protein [Fuerstiella sp.]
MTLEFEDPVVVAPTPTPFDNDDSIDFDALQQNIERWIRTPLSGFVLNSENGEESFLSEDEKLRIVRCVKQVCGDKRMVVAGIDSPSLTDTLRLAEAFTEAEADYIRLRIPRLTENVADYLHHIIPRCPLPVYVINQPAPGMFLSSTAPRNITAELIGDIATIDNVKGYIASADLRFEARVRTLVPAEKQFWTGNGSLLLAGAAIGADGACLMLGNVAPQECIDILKLTSQGNVAAAKTIQDRLHEADWQILSRRAAGLKAALNLLGFHAGAPRAPASECSADDIEIIRQAMVCGELL